MENIENIEELIADAKAEEAAIEKKKEEQFKTDLKNGLQDFFNKRNEEEKQNINIPLCDYLMLKMKERDLDILTEAIMDSLTLSYDKENLKIYDNKERIINAFRMLYNFAYDSILQDLQQEEGEE